MKKSSRPLHTAYNILEPKQLLAGDVTVVENGQLFIRGDESSNQIQIVATDDGEIHVTGLNTTTINGSSEPFVVGDSIDLLGARSRNAAFTGGLNIMMNGGHDRVDVRDIELQGHSWISTGDGDDFFRFHRSTSYDDLQLLSAEGDDSLRFFQSRTMGDFDARTGDGHDALMFWNSRAWQDAIMMTGEGDDTVIASYARFTGDQQQIFTQAGDDRVEISHNNINNSGLKVDTGPDHDRVIAEMAENNEILGMIEVNGRTGMDVLVMDGDDANAEMMTSEGFENNGGEVVFDHNEDIVDSTEVFDRGEQSRRFGAERVVFDEPTMISSVQWTGTYESNQPSTRDIFVIEIYEDTFLETQWEGDYNAPTGEPLATFRVGDDGGEDVDRTDTGKILDDPSDYWFQPRNVYSYEADIAFEMEANKPYWVSIHSLISTEVADDATFFELGTLRYDPEITNQSAYFTGGFDRYGEFQSFWLSSRRWDIALRS